MLTCPHLFWPRRSMDRTKVSGTFDVGSIPAGASSKSCFLKQDFLLQQRLDENNLHHLTQTKKRCKCTALQVPPRGLEPRTN